MVIVMRGSGFYRRKTGIGKLFRAVFLFTGKNRKMVKIRDRNTAKYWHTARRTMETGADG